MLRIHFDADDLARVRTAPGPDPLWELVLSLNKLQSPNGGGRYAEWRTRARDRIREAGVQRSFGILRTLVPPHGNFPDFMTPWEASFDLEAGYEAMLRLPPDRMLDDLRRTFRRRAAPSWVRDLADRRGRGMREIISAMRHYQREVLQPCEPQLMRHVEADLAARTRQLAQDGPVNLLRGLPAPIRWNDGVLEADYLVDHRIRLNGRGLTLVPSYFCNDTPVTLIDGELPPVLVFPASARSVEQPEDRDYLAGLVGATRAQILRCLITPMSTRQLAERVRVSSPAVSQHIGVLRGAGLVTSARNGQSVQHRITRLGRELIGG
ncbi:MAG: helix-turn-helix domain-containing protein [Pseudonocardiaceae bacterium]|nr:helix-turn-helix domain-containing protein [Pseudonocardiaceae bacterium]